MVTFISVSFEFHRTLLHRSNEEQVPYLKYYHRGSYFAEDGDWTGNVTKQKCLIWLSLISGVTGHRKSSSLPLQTDRTRTWWWQPPVRFSSHSWWGVCSSCDYRGRCKQGSSTGSVGSRSRSTSSTYLCGHTCSISPQLLSGPLGEMPSRIDRKWQSTKKIVIWNSWNVVDVYWIKPWRRTF